MISLIISSCHAPARVCGHTRALALAVLLMLCLHVAPARAVVGFVDYSGGKEAVPLTPYLEYLVDSGGRLDIERIFTQDQQSKFLPLSSGLPVSLRGTLWLRFTLPPAPSGLEPPFLRLDLGWDTPAGAVLYMPDGNLNAALATWIPQAPVEKNIFLLQLLGLSHQAQAPVTIYVKIPGAVGLWFAPQLLTTPPVSLEDMSGASILDMLAVFWSWLLSPSSSLVYVVLGALTVWCLARAFRRGGEWRLWTAVFAVLIFLQGMIPMPYAPAGKIPLQALLNVVVPGLCFILLVHVGRHLLHSKERRTKLDSFLVVMSLLGVILPVIPLAPGMSGFLRVMPLWPVLAVLPGLACLGAAIGNVPGAKRYAVSCLVLALGGILAWRAAGEIAPHPALVQAPLWAAAVFVFLVGVTHVRERRRHDVEEEDSGEEAVEVLRLNDMMGGETMDDLLPPLPQTGASAGEFSPEPAPELVIGKLDLADATDAKPASEDLFSAGNDSGLLSMAGADGMAASKVPLKLVPKLATMPVPARMPAPAPAWDHPGGREENVEPSGLDLDIAEPLIELKDIVTDREAELDSSEREAAAPAPVQEAEPSPEFGLEPEKIAEVFPEPHQPEAFSPEPQQPVMPTPEPLPPSSSVSQPRPVSAAAPAGGDKAPEEDDSALPWRRPLGGARKGIDMVGDLIRHGDPDEISEAAAKQPLLVGPDLLKVQLRAAQWSDRALEAVNENDESLEALPRVIAEEAAEEEDQGLHLAPVAVAGPEAAIPPGQAPAAAPGVDFNNLVDETAHADALWLDEASMERAPLESGAEDAERAFSQPDDWKLSDMAHHGRAPRESAAMVPHEPAAEGSQNEAATASKAETVLPGQRLVVAEEELQTSLTVLQALLDSPGRSGQDLYQAVREQSRTILDAGQRIMAQARSGFSQETQAESEALEVADLPERGAAAKEEIFDLQVVLSDAHGAVRGEAERRNLALSWFMPPHLPLLYLGDPEELREVLRQLLASAVAATEKGTVQLAVRRVPDSTDPGHLIFSVTDSGNGPGAARRNPLALKRAWSLAAAHGGGLNVESAPGQGSTVAFTMRLKRPPDDLYSAMPGLESDPAMLGLHSGGTEHISIISRQDNYILVVDEQATNRQLIAFFLGNLPYRVVEARSLDEAMAVYTQQPTGLVIFDSGLEGLVMGEALKALHGVDNSLKLSPVPVIALIQDQEEVAAMLSAGCKGALRKPLSRKRVRDLIQILLPGREQADSGEMETPESGSGFESAAAGGATASREPLKGSPEDYVSHLEFGLAEEAAVDPDEEKTALANNGSAMSDTFPAGGGVERPAEKGSAGDPEEEQRRNLMAGLDILHLGASTPRGEAEAGPEPASPTLEAGEPENFDFTDVQWETANPEKPGLVKPGNDGPERTGKNSAAGPETGIGRNRWLSGILDAAGKVAGAAVQRPRVSEKAEAEQPEPVPLDAQSLKVAGPEQLRLVPQVLESLDAAIGAAKEGLAEENCLVVSRACLRLADVAANHNLENLDRIARCVDRAAQANDLEAVHDLLAELAASVERNRGQLLAVLEDRGHFDA